MIYYPRKLLTQQTFKGEVKRAESVKMEMQMKGKSTDRKAERGEEARSRRRRERSKAVAAAMMDRWKRERDVLRLEEVGGWGFGLVWFGYKLGFRVFVVMKGMVTMSGGGNAGIVFVFFKTYKNHFSFLQKIRENSWLFCSSQKTEPTYFFLLFYDSYFYFFFVIQSNQIKIIINKNRIRIFFGE